MRSEPTKASMSRGTGFAGPQGGRPLGGRKLHEVSDRGALILPRDWFCQTAGAAVPSGGSALHEVKSVGANQSCPSVSVSSWNLPLLCQSQVSV
jgi:hypothetical protein